MDEQKTEQDKCLIVTLGGANYTLPVGNVERVLSLPRSAVSSVPFDGKGRVRGIFNYQGSVIALIRHSGLLPDRDKTGDETLTVVILQDEGRRFALPVDKATAVTAQDTRTEAIPLNVHALYTGEPADDH